MKWVRNETKFISGDRLFVGKWNVGGIHYNSLRAKNDPKKWKATCRLPGIKQNLGDYESEEEAKTELIKVVDHWFDNID